ncbi:MAG: cysteine hydrolase [Anaerolineae bacterium]|nr:cysteine hydrolase [Anaerolineae bacterium]
MKPALLIIDVQKRFFEISPTTAQSLDKAIKQINETIGLFREKQLPVFCIQHLHPENNLKPGVPGFDVPDEMAVLPTDGRIHKTYENAFNKTPLLEKLQEQGVDTVIVSGFAAEHCVLTTYRGAEDRDLKPIMLRGGMASAHPENLPFVESLGDVISYGALKQVLGTPSDQ